MAIALVEEFRPQLRVCAPIGYSEAIVLPADMEAVTARILCGKPAAGVVRLLQPLPL